jgi:hypothetical protein
VTVYQPSGAFVLVGGKPQPFPEAAQQETLNLIKLSTIYVAQHVNDPKYAFTISGSEKIGQLDTVILEISAEGKQTRWNVDPVSGKLIRVTRMVIGAGGAPGLTRFEYDDWRTVNGVNVPFKVFQNGISNGEIRAYQINPDIPPDFFDKPSGAIASSVSTPQSTSATSGCPIEILEVNPHHFVDTSEDPWGFALKIKYRNLSDKQIVAEKFAANFFNALHEKKESAWDYTSDQKIKPAETKNASWGDGIYVNEIGMRIGAEVWPVKVMFADETFWQDDGSMQCKSAVWATPVK